MRIALVSPLVEAVPPKRYGGTERVVSYLTEELVRLGHDVTLFASGDSVTSARLVASRSVSLSADETSKNAVPHHLLLLESVFDRMDEFDIVHFHVDLLHLPMTRSLSLPSVTTLHWRLDVPDLLPFYRHFKDAPLVSISKSQRAPLPNLNWVGNVYHGLPSDLYCPKTSPPRDGYLVFLGRMSPEKGPAEAIAIAKAAGVPLKIAARIDPEFRGYFDDVLRPLMDHPLIEFLGEVGDADKGELLSNAVALLFPIDWPEPFGLVLLESMACGTPVIARRRGAVPELIEDGITGYVWETPTEAIAAVDKTFYFDRTRCRAVFEERFTSARMATDYVTIYGRMLETPKSQTRTRAAGAVPRASATQTH